MKTLREQVREFHQVMNIVDAERPNGKRLKPHGWTPPDIKGELLRQVSETVSLVSPTETR